MAIYTLKQLMTEHGTRNGGMYRIRYVEMNKIYGGTRIICTCDKHGDYRPTVDMYIKGELAGCTRCTSEAIAKERKLRYKKHK